MSDACAVPEISSTSVVIRCDISKTAKETTAAIIWLSVIDEINIPTAINDAPIRKYAIIARYEPSYDTSPNCDKIIGKKHTTATGIAKIVSIDRDVEKSEHSGIADRIVNGSATLENNLNIP